MLRSTEITAGTWASVVLSRAQSPCFEIVKDGGPFPLNTFNPTFPFKQASSTSIPLAGSGGGLEDLAIATSGNVTA